jgi:hypothetical protein
VFIGIVPLPTLTGLNWPSGYDKCAWRRSTRASASSAFRSATCTHRSETRPQVEHVGVGPFRGLPCQVDVHAGWLDLAPERARSCRNAITMASVMVDEIRLRAHARPLN